MDDTSHAALDILVDLDSVEIEMLVSRVNNRRERASGTLSGK